MKTKRIFSIIGMVIATLIVLGGLIFLTVGMRYPFSLNEEYYGTTEVDDIDYAKLEDLTEDKKSFAVFVYQPLCETSASFEEVLDQFRSENSVGFYKIAFADLKDTELADKIKYYPSFMIFKNGELVEYLDAEADEDKAYYQDADNFKKWFVKYVNLKKVNQNNDSAGQTEIFSKEKELAKDTKPSDIKQNDGKVNIYFFWGDGCPHCAAEFEALNEIAEEHRDKFNLYTFETWYNEDNEELIKVFSEALDGKEAKGVPYTIIGEKSFTGFSEGQSDQLIEAITSQYQDAYDIYFDKVKNQLEKK